jgi:hypothetical protein
MQVEVKHRLSCCRAVGRPDVESVAFHRPTQDPTESAADREEMPGELGGDTP